MRPLTTRAMVAGLLATAMLTVGGWGCAKTPTFNGTLLDPPMQPSALSGVNWDGSDFSLEQLRGKVAILFFGYTYCPDVCPLTLVKMKQVIGRLGESAEEVAVVFITVDPDRDSVEKLASYVPNFDRDFYGVRLPDQELRAAQEALGLAIQYGEPKEGPGTDTFYYVDHTGSYFLVDREGQARVLHSPTSTPEQIAPDVVALLAG